MSKVIKERKKKIKERKVALTSNNRVNTPKHITQLHKLITQ